MPHLVTVDNGDTEPEVWCFLWEDQATAFAELRGSGASVQTISLLGREAAERVIAQERSQP